MLLRSVIWIATRSFIEMTLERDIFRRAYPWLHFSSTTRGPKKIAPSRFRNDLHAMTDDLRLDNFLAMRAAFGAGIPTYLDEFTERTRAVILLLESYMRSE